LVFVVSTEKLEFSLCSKNNVIFRFIAYDVWGNLFLWIETRCVYYCFGGCWAVICILGKKIGNRKILDFEEKRKLFWPPIFLSSLPNEI
jgi:hypothetical protein